MLTVRYIESIKATKTLEQFDTAEDTRGLALRVSPTGRKNWTFHYTFSGKRARLELGTYPGVGLDAARMRAREFRSALTGNPPRDPRLLAGAGKTVSEVVELYLAALARKPPGKEYRTLPQVARMLRNEVSKHIGEVPLADLTRITVRTVTARIEARGSLNMAFQVHKNFRIMLDWAIGAGYVEENIMDKMTPPELGEVGENARPLDDDDIKAFWHGVRDVLPEYCRDAFSRVLKLCLLTGCRLGEVAEIQPGEIVDGIWTIPGARTKNRRPHSIPLNADMLAIIGNDANNPWGLVEGKPLRSKWLSDVFCRADVPAALGSKDYTIHSLRRTAATIMEEIEIADKAISLCLNHTVDETTPKSDRASRSTRIYVKPKTDVLMLRKRQAFDAYTARLREIIA